MRSKLSGNGVASTEHYGVASGAGTIVHWSGGRFHIKLPEFKIVLWHLVALTILLMLWLFLIPANLHASPHTQEGLSEQQAALQLAHEISIASPLLEATPAGSGVITGTVVNGTTGQPVPGVPVLLGIMDGSTVVGQQSTMTDAEGVYRFEGLSTEPGLLYVARVEYPMGIPYSSEAASFSAGQFTLHLPIRVFDTTADSSGVWAERVHLIVGFEADRALIAELVVFSLDGDLTYIGDDTGVLHFTLPVGAQDLAISDDEPSGRYKQTDNGFVDTWPLPPGQFIRQVLFRYVLLFSGDTLELDRSLPYPIHNINVLISDPGNSSAQVPVLKVASAQLRVEGLRQTTGGRFISLVGQNLPANHPIQIRISNLSALTAQETTSTSVGLEHIGLAILITVVGVTAVLIAARSLWRRPALSHPPLAFPDRESLIDALASLENAYEAGRVSEATYRDQRMQLKAKLLDVLREEAAR